jgi:hypothetical protein
MSSTTDVLQFSTTELNEDFDHSLIICIARGVENRLAASRSQAGVPPVMRYTAQMRYLSQNS